MWRLHQPTQRRGRRLLDARREMRSPPLGDSKRHLLVLPKLTHVQYLLAYDVVLLDKRSFHSVNLLYSETSFDASCGPGNSSCRPQGQERTAARSRARRGSCPVRRTNTSCSAVPRRRRRVYRTRSSRRSFALNEKNRRPQTGELTRKPPPAQFRPQYRVHCRPPLPWRGKSRTNSRLPGGNSAAGQRSDRHTWTDEPRPIRQGTLLTSWRAVRSKHDRP